MNMRSSIIIAVLLSANIYANETNMEVVKTKPVFRNISVQTPVSYEIEVCHNYKRNNKGALEKVVDGAFGSTGGLVGAAAGVAVVDKLGGNTGAKVLGGLLGNKIGNDVSSQNKNVVTKCEAQTKTRYETKDVERLEHYLVTVSYGLNRFIVKRDFEPQVGDLIKVNLTVN